MQSERAVDVINELVKECHATARSKGFWEEQDVGGTKIALMHSELSEALEVLRRDAFDKEELAEEFADVIIRVFDFCRAMELDIADALLRKMAKNRERPRMHGKVF